MHDDTFNFCLQGLIVVQFVDRKLLKKDVGRAAWFRGNSGHWLSVFVMDCSSDRTWVPAVPWCAGPLLGYYSTTGGAQGAGASLGRGRPQAWLRHRVGDLVTSGIRAAVRCHGEGGPGRGGAPVGRGRRRSMTLWLALGRPRGTGESWLWPRCGDWVSGSHSVQGAAVGGPDRKAVGLAGILWRWLKIKAGFFIAVELG
jgi:hypothetical protein